MYETFSGREFGLPSESNDGAQGHETKDKKDKKKKAQEASFAPVQNEKKQEVSHHIAEQLLRPKIEPEKPALTLSDILARKEKKTDQQEAVETVAETRDDVTSPPAGEETRQQTLETKESVSMPEAAKEVLEYAVGDLADIDDSLSGLEENTPEAAAEKAHAQLLEEVANELQPLAAEASMAPGDSALGIASPAATVEKAVQAAYRRTLEQFVPDQIDAEIQKIDEAMAALAAETDANAEISEAAEVPETEENTALEPSIEDASEAAAAQTGATNTARGAAGSAFGAGGAGVSPQAGAFHAAAVPLPPNFSTRGYASTPNVPQAVREASVPAEQPRRTGEWVSPFIAGAVVMRLIDNRTLRRERKQHKNELNTAVRMIDRQKREISAVLRTVDVMSARISQLGFEAHQRKVQAAERTAVVPSLAPDVRQHAERQASRPGIPAAEALANPAIPAPEAPPPLVMRPVHEARRPAVDERVAMPIPEAVERPITEPVVSMYERRVAPSAAERSMPAASGEYQTEQPTPVVLWQAETRQHTAPAEHVPSAPIAPRAERTRPQPPVPVEFMDRQQLMAAAAEITVDAVSLSSVFENHQVSERGLRRMVAEYYRGGNVQRILQQEKHIKELSYERDPRYRDRLMEEEQAVSGASMSQQIAPAVSTPEITPVGSNGVQHEHITPPLLLPPKPRPLLQRHRSTVQPALIIANAVAFVILATLLVVLLVVYL